MKVSEGYPEAHAKYVVLRGGIFFTATPCYGMHRPWWVVQVMSPTHYPREAEPEDMLDNDEWWPLDEFPRQMMAERMEQEDEAKSH